MTTITITTQSGARITAEVDGSSIEISQDGRLAGTGTLSRKGRIEDCDARLGAQDGSETESAFEALEQAIAGMRS